jgi:hypothetical protein
MRFRILTQDIEWHGDASHGSPSQSGAASILHSVRPDSIGSRRSSALIDMMGMNLTYQSRPACLSPIVSFVSSETGNAEKSGVFGLHFWWVWVGLRLPSLWLGLRALLKPKRSFNCHRHRSAVCFRGRHNEGHIRSSGDAGRHCHVDLIQSHEARR